MAKKRAPSWLIILVMYCENYISIPSGGWWFLWKPSHHTAKARCALTRMGNFHFCSQLQLWMGLCLWLCFFVLVTGEARRKFAKYYFWFSIFCIAKQWLFVVVVVAAICKRGKRTKMQNENCLWRIKSHKTFNNNCLIASVFACLPVCLLAAATTTTTTFLPIYIDASSQQQHQRRRQLWALCSIIIIVWWGSGKIDSGYHIMSKLEPVFMKLHSFVMRPTIFHLTSYYVFIKECG